MKSTPTKTDRQLRGFTLLEILIVLVITGFVFQGLAQLTGSILKGWDSASNRLENQNVAFNAVDKMSEDISGAIPMVIVDEGEEVGSGIGSLFEGNSEMLTMIRPAVGFKTTFNLHKVTYEFEGLSKGVAIIRRSTPLVMTDIDSTETKVTRTVLAEFAGSISLSYSADGNNFGDEWVGQQKNPKAVRITLTLAETGKQQYLKTARIFAEVGPVCVNQDPEKLENCLTALGS